MTANAPSLDFHELTEFLHQTPSRIGVFVAGLSGPELRLPNSPDEFSVLENICHLRDLELQGYTPRIRRILAETIPALADFDGARVAAESDYNSENPGVALETFQSARDANIEILRGLTVEQLSREGTLDGVGSITLRRLAELMREHDEGHLDDLRSLRRRIERSRELTR